MLIDIVLIFTVILTIAFLIVTVINACYYDDIGFVNWFGWQSMYMSMLIIPAWFCLSSLTLDRKPVSKEYKIYQYEDIPAIVLENRILEISGLKNKNWTQESVTVDRYAPCTHIGIYYGRCYEIDGEIIFDRTVMQKEK